MRSGDAPLLHRLEAALAEVNSVDVVGLPDEQVRAEVLSLLTCLNQLTAAVADRVGSFDTRCLSESDAVRTTRHWLELFGRMSQGAATRWLVQARLLRQLPALADAVRAGTVSTEQVAKVAELAEEVGVEKLREFDQILADLASQAGPGELAKACQRILTYLDPDGAEPDPGEDWQRRELTFSRSGSTLHLRGRLDPEGGAALMAAVDALMRPPAPGDERSAAQRRADAVVDLARGALASDTLPSVAGDRPQIGLLVTPDMLLGTTTRSAGSAAAEADPLSAAGVPPLRDRPWLTWIGEISPETAQRLACDSTVWRTILDPATGLPLDVGRKYRIVPHWMRRALQARDRTCRWPGCDTPGAWCDAHHEIPWYEGGTTAIDKLLNLCRWHHGLVHEGRWTLTVNHTTGEVRVRRPDGRPYELGPSQPWTSPSRQGPQPAPPQSGPPRYPPDAQHPPDAQRPRWSQAA